MITQATKMQETPLGLNLIMQMRGIKETPDQFNAILKNAGHHVKHYESDFCHDQRLITLNPTTRFIHIAKEWGTHIILFTEIIEYPKAGVTVPYLFGIADRYHLLNEKAKTLKFLLSQDFELIQYFDGAKIRRISPDQATTYLKKYVESINLVWEHNC